MQNKPNFRKAENGCYLSKNKDLQQKTTHYELFKTNPNKANFKRHLCSEFNQ